MDDSPICIIVHKRRLDDEILMRKMQVQGLCRKKTSFDNCSDLEMAYRVVSRLESIPERVV